MNDRPKFQSYSWSLGTTSFRMTNFHRNVERQLQLINEFWNETDPQIQNWKNRSTQEQYYDYLLKNNFVTGNIQNEPDKKAKTARQKTSALKDIGLVDESRVLTDVGRALLRICEEGSFKSDNPFFIPSDSFLYLKQLLKTFISIRGDNGVRPFLILGTLLTECDDYLDEREFTFLLPLCIDRETTILVISGIHQLRQQQTTLDKIIVNTVLNRSNYATALSLFLESDCPDLIIPEIGMNRDGGKHDEQYIPLFNALKKVFLRKEYDSIKELFHVVKSIKHKPGTFWRQLLFEKTAKAYSFEDLKENEFFRTTNDIQFRKTFFYYLHLIKIKSTLSDYRDLNERWFKITDAVNFQDNRVAFAPLFRFFFKTSASSIFDDAFIRSKKLTDNCSLEEIHPCLAFNEDSIKEQIQKDYSPTLAVTSLAQFFEQERRIRFRKLIDTRFSNKVLLSILNSIKDRKDGYEDRDVQMLVGGDADVPTIFEYIISIAWYRISDYHGDVLKYMNLSLDADLLPRTHASGGVADVVYHYNQTNEYPEHYLLLECTLTERTNQRRAELEPVSRHLCNFLIDKSNNAYCVFVANFVHPTVLSDFRNRKNMRYYRNESEFVDDMKIIPLEIDDITFILHHGIKYDALYAIFEQAHENDTMDPIQWRTESIVDVLRNIRR